MTQSSTLPLSSSSASCCEKYAGTTPWPNCPASSVSTRVVFPDPFGPTRATCSLRSRCERDVRQQALRPGRHVEPRAIQHDAAASRWIDELEAERTPSQREGAQLRRGSRPVLLEPPDVRQLGLGSLGEVLLVAKAFDEALEPGDVGVVALDRLVGRERARSLLASPLVPRPGEVERASALELQHGGRDRLEEPAVVRNEDHACIERGEGRLEPLEIRDVEMVRRLVEEEQVRVAREGAAERCPGQLASRERTQAPVEVVVGEAEPAQHRCRARSPVPAARVLESRDGLRVAAHRRLVVAALLHGCLEPT